MGRLLLPSHNWLASLEGRLILSCLTLDGDPFRDPESSGKFARAAELGGAVAIPMPCEITRHFVTAMARGRHAFTRSTVYIGVDLGGTNTKYRLAFRNGKIPGLAATPTPMNGRPGELLQHLKRTVEAVLDLARNQGLQPEGTGIASAGWVSPRSGRGLHTTSNLPGWSGTEVAREIDESTGLHVSVENHANTIALAERHFGHGRVVDDCVCLTLGTGVGCGCFIGKQPNHEAHCFANVLGHITIEVNGAPCTCGHRGCLGAYTSAAALMRYAGRTFESAEAVIQAALTREGPADTGMRRYSEYLTAGLASAIHLLDPVLIILSGGLTQSTPYLFQLVNERLATAVNAWEHRRAQVVGSDLSYFGGILGGIATHLERLNDR